MRTGHSCGLISCVFPFRHLGWPHPRSWSPEEPATLAPTRFWRCSMRATTSSAWTTCATPTAAGPNCRRPSAGCRKSPARRSTSIEWTSRTGSRCAPSSRRWEHVALHSWHVSSSEVLGQMCQLDTIQSSLSGMRAISFFLVRACFVVCSSGGALPTNRRADRPWMKDPLGEVAFELVRWHPHPQQLPGTYTTIWVVGSPDCSVYIHW